jgi:hypothetical protein
MNSDHTTCRFCGSKKNLQVWRFSFGPALICLICLKTMRPDKPKRTKQNPTESSCDLVQLRFDFSQNKKGLEAREKQPGQGDI